MDEAEFIYRGDGLFVHLVMEPKELFRYEVWYLIERMDDKGVLVEKERKERSFWRRKSADNYWTDTFAGIQEAWIHE